MAAPARRPTRYHDRDSRRATPGPGCESARGRGGEVEGIEEEEEAAAAEEAEEEEEEEVEEGREQAGNGG